MAAWMEGFVRGIAPVIIEAEMFWSAHWEN
jgi:hypothetical protein